MGSEEYRELKPTLDTAVRVATRKTGEDIQDGVEVPELVREIVAMYPVLTGYIDALEAENAELRTALEEIATMPNKPGYHNTWLGRWLAARDAAENALAATIEGEDSSE